MVGFICFARWSGSHIMWKGWNLAIVVWYWDGSSDYLMVFVHLAWSLNQSLAGSALSSSDDAFLLSFSNCSARFEAFLHSLRSPKVRLLYLRSFRAKQMNRSVASQYIGLTLFLRIWPWSGFPGFPVSVFLSGCSRFTERTSVFALDLLLIFPSLVRLYITTAPRICQALF